MLRTRLLPPLALLAFATACATPGGAVRAPGADAIHPGPTAAAFLSDLEERLETVGFETERAGEILRAEHERTYAYLLSYDEMSRRLVHIAFFNLEPGYSCASADLQVAISEANRRYNLGKVYCDTEDDTVGYEGVVLVPRAGLEATELRDYFAFLSSQMRVMAQDTGLWELLR